MEETTPFQKWMFRRLISFGIVLALVLIGLLVTRGGKRTSTKATQITRPAEDPWQKALAALRRETDVDSCRRTLQDLNLDLAKVPAAEQPEVMPPAELAALVTELGLEEHEANELKPGTYTGLDGAHLADAIYLRDVAVGINVAALPPAQRAAAAFAWVCRQVVLSPWVGQGEYKPPLSPSFVLRRGSGSGLERAYVFVELCRQLDLDAGFIGPSDAKARPWSYRPGEPNGPPRGPFWAGGVRVEKQVALFDPWAGEPLPFTLEQLRAQPAEFAPQVAALAKANGVAADAFRNAGMFHAAPLSAFAPRWKVIEEKLAGDRGVTLFVNPDALKKRTAGVFWNPPGDEHSPTRTLAYTLSVAEGGFAPNHPAGGSQLALQYKASLIPTGRLFAVPPELTFKEPRERIVAESVGRYVNSYLTPPTPRERFQRGRYAEAIKLLVREWEGYTKMTERARNELERAKVVGDWIKRANAAYEALNGAADPAARDQAQNDVDGFWKSDARGVELIVEQTVGPAGTGEATFLLALCKNEQAERLADRAATDPEAVGEAWREAADWWGRYAAYAEAQEANYPGRRAHAAKLAARATRMAEAAQ